MPSARTTICGSALNSRFGVNGIQYSSSEMRFVRGLFLDREFGMAHRGLLRRASARVSRATTRTPRRHMLGSTSNRTPLRPGCGTPRRLARRSLPGAIVPTCKPIREIPMRVGVPKEIKVLENRVGLVPGSVRELVGARPRRSSSSTTPGRASAWTTTRIARPGATVVATAAEVFAARRHDRQGEGAAGRSSARCCAHGQILFTYLHLAPDPEQAADLVASGAVCIAYETVTSSTGGLPLLAPMSEVAGRMAVQAGAYYLEKPHGGLGMLLGGVPGVDPAKVVDPGRRRRRLARVPHRARHGRRRLGARPQRRRAARAVAAVRPAAQHGVLDARRGRESRDAARTSSSAAC